MIIPFLKHITKIQNQRGKVKYFVVYFQKKGDKYQVLIINANQELNEAKHSVYKAKHSVIQSVAKNLLSLYRDEY